MTQQHSNRLKPEYLKDNWGDDDWCAVIDKEGSQSKNQAQEYKMDKGEQDAFSKKMNKKWKQS